MMPSDAFVFIKKIISERSMVSSKSDLLTEELTTEMLQSTHDSKTLSLESQIFSDL